MLYDRLIQVVSKSGWKVRNGSSSRLMQASSDRLGERVLQFVADHSTGLIRIFLATIFIWFGLLKVIGPSSLSDLVAKTGDWLPVRTDFLIFVLGTVEIALGFGLLFSTGVMLRLALCLYLMYMAGTFLALVVRPDLAFIIGNPFLLTTIGEYVMKNLVLIAAGLALFASTARSRKRD